MDDLRSSMTDFRDDQQPDGTRYQQSHKEMTSLKERDLAATRSFQVRRLRRTMTPC